MGTDRGRGHAGWAGTHVKAAILGAPADELIDGRPWFIADDEPEGDPLADAAPTAEGHVWVITAEGPVPFEDEGPGLSCAVVAATVAAALDAFIYTQDHADFTWYREDAGGTYWQAVRWEADHMPGWRVYALVMEQVVA